MLVSANHAVPETGVSMNVRKPSTKRDPIAPICRFRTILFGETNFRLTSTGPPNIASIQFGMATSGTASSGMSVSAFIVPAAFFLLGADDLTTLPSYK
jgi:hypothetical protein